MTTKFGLHVTTGSRNGYGPVVSAAPAVVLAVNEGGALVEANANSSGRTITIFRDTTIFPDAPPNIDHMTEAEARATADYYWPALKAKYDQNPAGYYQAVNETGGDNPVSLRNIVAFEMRLMELAERDGYRLCVGSPAGGSPGDFELWKQFYVPLIRRAAQGEHIYGRHAYGGVVSGSSGMLTKPDGTPADDNAGRPFREAAYLRSQGILTPMVITEAGQNGGFRFPGVDAFMEDVARYDALCRQYDNIWGFCAWTYGIYQDGRSNIESASSRMAAYLQEQGGAVRLPYPDPAIIEEDPMETKEQRLWRLSVEIQRERGIQLAPTAIQDAIRADSMHPVIPETYPSGEPPFMAAEDWSGQGRPRRVYYWEDWQVHNFTDPAARAVFSSPVGTVAERESRQFWPGDWVDATGFAMRYLLSGSYNRHTGADLNLNKPSWNADRGLPVHAAGDGVVTYARLVPSPSTWGRLVVIRHTLPDGKLLHTRYGHMGSFLVQEGQQVRRGDVLGTIGAVGLSAGQDHLHFDVSHSGILESTPRHWPGDSLTGVLNNYLDPRIFLQGKADALVEPAQLLAGPAGTIGLVGNLQANVISQYYPYKERPLSGVKYLVIHHSAGNPNNPPASLAEGHINRDGGGANGYPGIGYHYVITGDGKVHRTQRLETHSYHTGGSSGGVSNNGAAVGICLGGSFMDGAVPTAAQLAACRTLISWLRQQLPGVEVRKHLDFNATACPGNTWASWWEAATGQPTTPVPAPTAIDLLPYIKGDGRAYMVRHPSGAQEKFRTEVDGPWFYLVKNSQFEQFRADSQYIWRGLDSSPGPAPDYDERPGALRFYAQREPGNDAARWCPRYMAVGQTWAGPGHTVSFYYKDTCQPSNANSGPAQNVTRFVARHASKTWNGITLNDVIELDGGPDSPEKFYYAKAQGDFAGGLAAWESKWGSSAVSELNVAPDNTRERLC